MDDLLEFGLLGGAIALVWWSLSGQAPAASGGRPAAPGGAPATRDAYAAAFASGGGGGGFSPAGFGSKGNNVGPGQDDNTASASPFVYVNLSKGFPSGCSTHLWDGKPLCA